MAALRRVAGRLAAEGVWFEQFYVNSPICSPSRTAISTGQYPQRWRISSYLNNRKNDEERGMAQWLDPKAPMLARSLQTDGYATGHFECRFLRNRPTKLLELVCGRFMNRCVRKVRLRHGVPDLDNR